MRTVLAVVTVLACTIPVPASEPGQPLDCSDWVSVERGVSCSHYVAFPCPDSNEWCRLFSAPGEVLDTLGRRFRTRTFPVPGEPACPVTNNFMLRRQLVAFDGATEQLVGYIDERCGGVEDHIQPSVTFLFDSHAGRLLIFDLRSFVSFRQACVN